MNMDQMITKIKTYMDENSAVFIQLSNIDVVTNVYNALFNNVMKDDGDGVTYYYCGIYFEIMENYGEMIKYYHRSSDLGNAQAMNNLGVICYHDNDLLNMKKYYLDAIKCGNVVAMYNLAQFYMNNHVHVRILQEHENGIDELMNSVKNNMMISEFLELCKFLDCDKYKKQIVVVLMYFISNEDDYDDDLLNFFGKIDIKCVDGIPTIYKMIHNALNIDVDMMLLHDKYEDSSDGFDKAMCEFINNVIKIA